MSFKRILSFALAVAMCFSLLSTGVAFADGEQTVTINPNNGTELTYTVELDENGYVGSPNYVPDDPVKPDSDDGYRYVFTGWRCNGASVTFPTKALDGAVIDADYEMYLAYGYEYKIVCNEGTFFLNDESAYTAPISELKARYTGITQAVPVMMTISTENRGAVAQVGETTFPTLAAAVAEARNNGFEDEVVLLNDINGENITLQEGDWFTVNTGSYSIGSDVFAAPEHCFVGESYGDVFCMHKAASIGDQEFNTVAAALKYAAQNYPENCKITILAENILEATDEENDSYYGFRVGYGDAGYAWAQIKNLTLDLNEFTIAPSNIEVYDGATVTIQNGTIEGNANAYGGKLIIENNATVWNAGIESTTVGQVGGSLDIYGTVTTTVSANGGGAVSVFEGASVGTANDATAIELHDASLNISGGSINSDVFVPNDDSTVNISGGTIATLDLCSGAEVSISGGTINELEVPEGYEPDLTISGGTFNEVNIPSGKNITDYLEEGASYDSTTGVVASYVAQIEDGEKYETLEEAFAAAQNGDTITLLESVSLGSTITVNKQLTLNLNGKTITTSADDGFMFDTGADMTLTDTANGGKISHTGAYDAFDISAGKLTVAGGEIATTARYGAVYSAGGTLIIDGGTLSSTYANKNGSIVNCQGASTLTMTSGTVSTATGNTAITVAGTSTAAISGGTVTGGDWGVTAFDTAAVTISGTAEISAIGTESYGISTNGNAGQNATINITGGTVTGNALGIYQPSGTLNISGGTITGATAIYQKSGTLNISGSPIFKATGEKAELSHDGNGANPTGDAIVVESCQYPNGTPSMTIAGTPTITVAAQGAAGIGDYTYNDPNQPDEPAEAAVTATTATLPTPSDNVIWVPTETAGEYKLGAVVAKIDDAPYATLEAAFAAAQDGNTITLLTDVTLSEGIDVANTVTLDMAGHEITSTVPDIFTVTSTGNLTITGDGTITGPANGQSFDGRVLIGVNGTLNYINGTMTATGSGSDGMYGVYVYGGGTANFGDSTTGSGPRITSHFAAIGENHMTAPANVTVHGGTYTATANPSNGEWWSYFCAPFYAAGSGDITINGGTFNGYYAISDRYADVVQTLTINGGTFNGSSNIDIFAAEVDGSGSTANRTIKANVNTLDVPNGYMWVGDAQNGYELAVAVAKDANNVTYATLAEAMAQGGTITLLTDVTLSEGIDVANTVTLEMAGYTITYNSSAATKAEYDELFDVASTGNLTITGDGTITGPANGQLYDGRALIVVDAGRLTIENGTLTATGSGSDGMYGVYILANGTAIFGKSDGTGPSITSHFAAIGENHMTAPANVTVYGGAYTANANPTNNEWWSYFCAPVYAAGSGTITISGGTFNGYYAISDRYADVVQTLTISDGTFNGNSGIAIFAAEVNGSGSTANRAIKANVNTLDVPDGYMWVGDAQNGYELVHIHDWNNPVIVWEEIAGGWKVASCKHTCSLCGVTEDAEYEFDTRLFQGVYTFTATVDEYSESKTVSMKYYVDFNGTKTYHDWGETVSLTANEFSTWKINGNVVADGLQIYTFTVTENSTVTIEDSQNQTPQAVISSTLTSTEAGRAVFNVKWSLPTGAQVQSVIAYRGNSGTIDKNVMASALIDRGTQHVSSLRVLNGDYTLRLYNMTSGYYQHVILVVTYTLGGETYTLTSGTASGEDYIANRVCVK